MAQKHDIRLSDEDRKALEYIVSGIEEQDGVRNVSSAKKKLHARVLLKANEGPQGFGWTDVKIADELGIHWRTVGNIRKRYVEEGLEASLNRKKQARPSRERILDEEAEARLITMANGAPPEGQERWTLQLLADQMVQLNIVKRISYETVRQKLKNRSEAPAKL